MGERGCVCAGRTGMISNMAFTLVSVLTLVSCGEICYVVGPSHAFVCTPCAKNTWWEEWQEENVYKSVPVTEAVLFIE